MSENTNNILKELFDRNEESETDEENDDVFINLENIEKRIERLKMSEEKPRVSEQSESSNRASYAREDISIYERAQSQYFKSSKLKKEYKTLGEYRERSITHDGVWLDIDCLKNRDKIITTWIKSMNIALVFHNLDR